MSRQSADQFDVLLQNQLRMFDLAYRVDDRRWVWVFDANAELIVEQIEAIADAASQRINGLRLNWSDPQILPLDRRHNTAILCDLLIRESLASRSPTSLQLADHNHVRLGTAPIAPSQVAATRLDEELRRLSERFKAQNQALRRQVKNLRPQP
jgi:hypothetical protein